MNLSSSAQLSRRTLAAAIGIALASSAAHADTFSVTTNADSGPGSFRGALNDANAAAGPHTVDLSAISGQTITLASSLPTISEDLTLQGSDVTLSGDEQFSCLDVDGQDLEINAMTVTECVAPSSGIQGPNGAAWSNRGGPVDSAGGGVRVVFGNLTVNDSTITGNTAPYDQSNSVGGGVAVKYGDLSVNNSTISNNSAYIGGGVYAAGTATISGSTIADNTSAKYGGGIAVVPSSGGPTSADERGIMAALTLDGTTVSGNSSYLGGGLFAVGPSSISESTVTGNSGGVFAGALLGTPTDSLPPHEIQDSTFSDNQAYYAYGGLAVTGSSVVTGTTISGNSAQYEVGGAAFIAKYEGNSVEITNSTISGNSAESSGGLLLVGYYYNGTASPFTLNGVTVTGNSATAYSGGGVATAGQNGPVTFGIVNSIIAGNSAAQGDPDLGVGGPTPGAANWPGRGEFFGGERGDPGSSTFNVDFTLLGVAPTTGTFNPDAATSSLLGANPQLGPLADNGGLTFTHLPGATGAGVDAIPDGQSGCGTTFSVDQRGQARPVGAGCDLGSIEIAGVPPVAEPVSVPVLDRFGLMVLAFGAGLLGLFGLTRRRRQS